MESFSLISLLEAWCPQQGQALGVRGYSGLLTETCALPHIFPVPHTHGYIMDFGSFKSVNERKDSK